MAACAKALKEGALECPEMPHAETIRVMEFMDERRKEWGIEYPLRHRTDSESGRDLSVKQVIWCRGNAPAFCRGKQERKYRKRSSMCVL